MARCDLFLLISCSSNDNLRNNLHFIFSFWYVLGIIKASIGGVHIMSVTFGIIMLVFAMFIVAMLTAGYNEDKTSGL